MMMFKKIKIAWWGAVGFLMLFLFFWTRPVDRTTSTIKIYDRNQELLYEKADQVGSQENVSFDQIPNTLIDLLILTEDKNFYQHQGVDLAAIARAVYQNLRHGQVISGASTITQQLARFQSISPNSPAKQNVTRKIREILMALRLELKYDKKEILERYLNIMYFGHNSYGLKAAANLYFGKDLASLSWAEQATLVGLIQNPTAYDPINYPENCLARRNAILTKAKDAGLIKNEQYENEIASSLPLILNFNDNKTPHLAQMVLAEVERLKLDSRKGLVIETTVDKNWNEISQTIASSQVMKLRQEYNLNNAAVVIIENQTGKILALVGSVNYDDPKIEGQNNLALAARQPGSTLKPFIYAAAFQNQIATPATMIDDSPKNYLTHDGISYAPQNYDGRFRGPVLVREALGSSYNLAAVEMLDRITIPTFLKYAESLGLKTLTEGSDYDLSMALGGVETTLLELTNAYATLGRNGSYLPTHFIETIHDNNHKLIYQYATPSPSQVFKPQVSYLITDILSDNKARIPTFTEKNILKTTYPSAVKTGTTTDWHDNWTVGYTLDFTVGVWVGNTDNEPMLKISGITGAAPIWNNIMEELMKNFPYTDFDIPDGISQWEICAWDGLLPSADCKDKYIEKFISGTEPKMMTNLSSKNNESMSLAQIINPKQNAVFAINEQNESLSFEISNVNNYQVSWVLNQQAAELNCQAKTNVCFWKAEVGNYHLQAVVNGQILDEVDFKVVNQY